MALTTGDKICLAADKLYLIHVVSTKTKVLNVRLCSWSR